MSAGIVAAVWEHARTAPDRVALRTAGSSWTYGRLQDRADALRVRARAEGLRAGDRVLLVAPTVPEFAAAYLGLLAAGAVLVTSNTMSTARELTYVVDDAGCTQVHAWHGCADAASQVAVSRGLPLVLLGAGLDDLPDDLPDAAGHAPDPVDPDAAAVVLYTSGTTGQPKGAVLSHAALRACAETFVGAFELGADDRLGTALPLFHVFGQAVVMGSALTSGIALSLLERFDAPAMLEMLARDRLTVVFGVPTMWNALLQVPDEVGDATSLRLAISGGAALPSEVLRAVRDRFGALLLEGYALTETCGTCTFSGLHRPRIPGSAGGALPGFAVQVRTDDGTVLGPDEVGEIVVTGPTLMTGYWGRPEATAEVLRDGWLWTGDLGRLDTDGELTVVDRKKDLIIRGGYNIYPREVEETLIEHPNVVEVAVVGVPDEFYGEEVAAVVAVREGTTLDLTELREWTRERLSAYKIPRLFHVVDALPKGPTGKILKRAIDVSTLRRADAPEGAP